MIGYIDFVLHGKNMRATLMDNFKWVVPDPTTQTALNTLHDPKDDGPGKGYPGVHALHQASIMLKGEVTLKKQPPAKDNPIDEVTQMVH